MASNLANQAAGVVDSVATWFESKEPADLLSEVTHYARRNPGTFLAIAAGAGLVVGRLARSLKDDASDDADSTAQVTAGSGSAGYTTGTYATPTTDTYTAPTTDTYAAPTTSAYGTGTSGLGTPDVPRTTGGLGGTA